MVTQPQGQCLVNDRETRETDVITELLSWVEKVLNKVGGNESRRTVHMTSRPYFETPFQLATENSYKLQRQITQGRYFTSDLYEEEFYHGEIK